MHFAIGQRIRHLTILFACLGAIVSAADGADRSLMFEQKLSAPQKCSTSAAITPFDKQFSKDTGATEKTLRTVFTQVLPLGDMHSTEHIVCKFDLSDWPAKLRSQARLWIAIGAPATISTAGVLNLTFSQNGCGMSTALNNNYNLEGMMILGSDYLLKDGEVTVDVENGTPLTNTACTLYVVGYVPEVP